MAPSPRCAIGPAAKGTLTPARRRGYNGTAVAGLAGLRVS